MSTWVVCFSIYLSNFMNEEHLPFHHYAISKHIPSCVGGMSQQGPWTQNKGGLTWNSTENSGRIIIPWRDMEVCCGWSGVKLRKKSKVSVTKTQYSVFILLCNHECVKFFSITSDDIIDNNHHPTEWKLREFLTTIWRVDQYIIRERTCSSRIHMSWFQSWCYLPVLLL